MTAPLRLESGSGLRAERNANEVDGRAVADFARDGVTIARGPAVVTLLT